MRQDFGSEFVNLGQRLGSVSTDASDDDVRAGAQFDQVRFDALGLGRSVLPILPPQGIVFYIPPGRYLLPRRRADVESGTRTRYELPENVELYVCQGALIRPEEGVDLVIRGSVRAGPYQIFGYDRFRPHVRDRIGLNTVPLGRVIFATRKVPALHPEWWGALPVSDDIAQAGTPLSLRNGLRANDSSDALQAAIDAACVTHEEYPEQRPDGPRTRPSIPVLLAGLYASYHTLRVDAPPAVGGSRLLVLRGHAGRSPEKFRQSTILSLPIPPGAYEGLTERPEDPAERCLLRLGANVHFEFEDLHFSMNDSPVRAAGCVDVRCDPSEKPRRGLIRRCVFFGGTRYTLRVTAPDDAALRHFVLDTARIVPGSVNTLNDRGVDLDAGLSTMVHVDGCILNHVPTPFDARNPRPPHPNAVIHLQGGSMLVRSSMFHNATGPRPSRGSTLDVDSLRLDEPDGHEVFLARAPGDRPNHFTGVHMECQGWWFLSRPKSGDDHVVLINLAHSNIHRNWNDLGDRGAGHNAGRYRLLTGRDVPDINTVSTKGAPPSVVWLGTGGRCVLIGCRLDYYLLTEGVALNQIVDVGTAFLRYRPGAQRPESIRLKEVPGSVVALPEYVQRDLMGQTGDGGLLHLVPYTIT